MDEKNISLRFSQTKLKLHKLIEP